jgi:murein DD-endopeptidase MepM/ murein hydrolase activator NlpD
MYHPKHRASFRRRPSVRPVAVTGIAALAVAAALSPTAYADPGGPPGGRPLVGVKGHEATVGKPSGSGNQDQGKQSNGKSSGSSAVGKPSKAEDSTKDSASDDDGNDATSGAATNGGHALAGDATTLAKLVPTAAPVTAYEMPFPCGEVWTGSTRPGHSPSIRAVDFNYAGGDLGKPVLAAASGTVTTAVVGKNRPSYGQYVVIDHGNGESTLYAHLDSVLVTVGQPITIGTQLGTVGETGNADGSHLHFEERKDNAVVDAWFHGAPFPMNASSTSQNCGTTTLPAASTDIPLAGDLYGGKAAESMVYRRSATPSSYFVDRKSKQKQIRIGNATAQPVLGDWDGDGKENPGYRDPASRTFFMKVRRTVTTLKFGKKTDLPVAGNWDGVGGWEVGVRRQASAKFILRNADGTKTKVALGDANDLPVTGDWDGDGITDLGVYDQATATYTLLERDPVTGAPVQVTVPFGTPGDLPVTGDWNGDGITELGSWSPYTTVFSKRGVTP